VGGGVMDEMPKSGGWGMGGIGLGLIGRRRGRAGKRLMAGFNTQKDQCNLHSTCGCASIGARC